jgi:hypothetical protein
MSIIGSHTSHDDEVNDESRGTAFHEAGHAVAAFLLDVPIVEVSILPIGDTAGHVRLRVRSLNRREDDLMEPGYAAQYGGFIDGSTRRWVERNVMFGLAGGLTEIRATGAEDHQVGIGIVKPLSVMQRDAVVARVGAQMTERIIVGGDVRSALELCLAVSGSDEEASAYLQWLECRTVALMGRPDFWPAVEGVVAALLAHGTLRWQVVRTTIEVARDEWAKSLRSPSVRAPDGALPRP